MRIGGLASGMDIDSLVKDLMKAERMPLDKMTQKKQFLEWQRDDYREMNKSLLELDQLIFEGIGRQANFIKKSVSVSDTNVLSIKNINSTSDLSGSISVTQLAASATMRSTGDIGIDDPTIKLDDYGISGLQTIEIQAITKDGVLQTEPYKLTFDPTQETLNSVIEKINKDSNVTVFFDSGTGKIAMTAKNSGDVVGDAEIKLTDTAGDFFATHLLLDTDNITAAANGSLGKNAEFTYNGLTTERNSNTFQINGVEFSLKNLGNDITFSSSPDVDAVVDTIVKFVDKYNQTIEKINNEINEKRYRQFQPLTSEQKEAMGEKEIEMWEEKAKSGTLRGDSILAGSLSKMRLDIYSPVAGMTTTNQLAEIGIKTSVNYLEGGKLIINEEDLRKAITDDPNAVYELFNKAGDSTSDQGIAKRLRGTIKDVMSDIEEKAGKSFSVNHTFVIGKNLDDIDKQITRFEQRLMDVEDRYWRQFTAMEKAIQQSNQQSMYLMQQFGGGA